MPTVEIFNFLATYGLKMPVLFDYSLYTYMQYNTFLLTSNFCRKLETRVQCRKEFISGIVPPIKAHKL